ncbi:MAG: 23S rRNA (guanosine(2251)-2'-O)-methyltransferase RlmB [Treponema sp.]|nr:23S rRNA (guanosine(2251)-2'-O)-methyltransferase RlmB [Treponema sp.]
MIITGFHSIEEKVRSQKKGTPSGFKIFFSKPGPRVKKILAAAKEAGITCEQTDDSTLDSLVADLDETLRDHRGIVMEIRGGQKKAANIVDFDSWIKTHSGESAKEGEMAGGESKRVTVVILDCVTDPHNVGAIIRSCDQFGASLVVLPEHNSASDIAGNEVIGRTSAGASAYVPVAIVNNLVRATEQLKQAGFWVYGADAGGQNCRKIDFPLKSVLIMGSEGTGISTLLEKQCDTIVSIPTCGKIDSLNVSVAAGVLLYEISSRQN